MRCSNGSGCRELQYSWTRLGYTYDWDVSTGEIGVSEFVIRQGAHVIVERVENYESYLIPGWDREFT